MVGARCAFLEGRAITQGVVQPAITVGVLLLRLVRGATPDGQLVLVGSAAALPQDIAPDTLVSIIRAVAKGQA